jgi:hypothetical protein
MWRFLAKNSLTEISRCFAAIAPAVRWARSDDPLALSCFFAGTETAVFSGPFALDPAFDFLDPVFLAVSRGAGFSKSGSVSADGGFFAFFFVLVLAMQAPG